MAMPMIEECHSPSFKDKLKSTISCFTCRNDDVERLGGAGIRRSDAAAARSHCSWLKSAAAAEDFDDGESLGAAGGLGFRRSDAAAARSHCSWLKSAEDLDVKDKCLGMIGKRGKNTRRRYNSADFRYDLASYALYRFQEIHLRRGRDASVPELRVTAAGDAGEVGGGEFAGAR